jgi:diphosphomevalonate decarboxylase
MKSSAIAHSNIALIKYWGRSSELNIPLNDSISMTKNGIGDIKLKAHTTIDFSEDFSEDVAILNGEQLSDRNLERILLVINPLREKSAINLNFKMESKNDFPTQSGLASSAAGFAALATAASAALELKLSKEELSTYARLGSGSAARSIHDGFVHWHTGEDHESSFAEQICEPNDFQMNAVIAVINEEKKKVTSDVGHDSAFTSPLNSPRVTRSQEHAELIRKAILDDDFTTVGKIAESSALYMHAVMMTSNPALYYWSSKTEKVMDLVRDSDINCFFTIDAGPNVHVLCRPENREEVEKLLSDYKTIPAEPGEGSSVVQEHLF